MSDWCLVRQFVKNNKLNYLNPKERKQVFKTGKLPPHINKHHVRFKSYSGSNSEKNQLPLTRIHHYRIHKLHEQIQELDKLNNRKTPINNEYFIFLIEKTMTNSDKNYKKCVMLSLEEFRKPIKREKENDSQSTKKLIHKTSSSRTS